MPPGRLYVRAAPVVKTTRVEFLKDASGTRTELDLALPAAFLASEQDADSAAKPASGDDQDSKAEFWKGASQSGPGA